MKVTPIFRWYDLWIGVFIDRPGRSIYFFPVPCFGIKFSIIPKPWIDVRDLERDAARKRIEL